MRGLGLRLRRLLGGCDIAVETGAQKCGIICGKNAMEQFETVLSAASRFTMGFDLIVSFSLRWRARMEFDTRKQCTKILCKIYSC